MRLYLTFFLSIALIATSFSQKKAPLHELELQRDGRYYRINTIPPFTGTAYEDFPNGKRKARAEFKDGKLHGKVRQWHETTGELASIQTYKDGIQYGEELQYYPTGTKKIKVVYQNDMVQGETLEWHENGQLKSKGNFVDGLEEGLHQWWFISGETDQTVVYKNGLAHGKVKHYYKSGQLKMETDYKSGKPDGLMQEWHDNSQPKTHSYFKEGLENGWSKLYSKKGILLEKRLYDMGKITESYNYRSGAVRSEDGYIQVVNKENIFYTLSVESKAGWVEDRAAADITYIVDDMLLQMINAPLHLYTDTTKQSSTAQLLEQHLQKEQSYIEKMTNAKIDVKQSLQKNKNGLEYLLWSFETPIAKASSFNKKMMQKEMYASFVMGEEVLMLYTQVTKVDDESKVKNMLLRTADSVKVHDERIDLNALRDSLLDK